MMTLEISTQLLVVATLLQTAELIQLRPAWDDSGVWAWSTLSKELPAFLRIFLNARGFTGVLFVRVAASLILLLIPSQASLLAILFLTTWLIAIRWRGTFNGGSDSMTAVVALGLWLARVAGDEAWLVHGALAFIAVQLTLSYFLAGMAKVRNPQWRSGEALPALFEISVYASPPEWVGKTLSDPRRARYLAWALMAFELGFPLAWLGPWICFPFLAAGIAFHLVNFKVLGLNRFFWAWLAAYPALYFWSLRIAS
jgi:hypothetical protein